jgi:hypothetical protein
MGAGRAHPSNAGELSIGSLAKLVEAAVKAVQVPLFELVLGVGHKILRAGRAKIARMRKRDQQNTRDSPRIRTKVEG